MTKAAAEPTVHAIIHMNSNSHVTKGAPDSVCRTVLTLVVNALHLMTRSQRLGSGVTLPIKYHPHILSARTLVVEGGWSPTYKGEGGWVAARFSARSPGGTTQMPCPTPSTVQATC